MISQDFLKAVASQHRVSNAEFEVLSLAMSGEPTLAIANTLGISQDAVRKRLSEVYHKFHIPGKGPVKRTQLQQLLVNQYQEQTKNTLCLSNGGGNDGELDSPPTTKKRIDWDGAPDVSRFYGREAELATLKNWIIQEECRLVALLGMGGIGKTATGVKLANQIQEQFDFLVWRSLYYAPSLSDLLTELIEALSGQKECFNLDTLEKKERWLISHCRNFRCLIVLDSFDSLLCERELAGKYREGYHKYGSFLRRIGEEPLKSCVLLTTREKVSEISLLEGESSPVRSLRLEGMGDAARLLLKEKGLSGQRNWDCLIKGYGGNPLMLKIVAIAIKEVFDGNVTDFLSTTLFTREVTDFVEEMLERVSELEKKVVCHFARQKRAVSLQELQQFLPEVPAYELIKAVASLRGRSLIDKSEEGFILPAVVMEVTNQLFPEVSN